MKIINPSYQIEPDLDGMAMLRHIEKCGRICYKSEEKITDISAIDFVKNKIMKSGHHSVIEHRSFSVTFICNRGITHEQVRHRLVSYSQESTRYCNYSKDKFGNSVTFIKPIQVHDGLLGEWDQPCDYEDNNLGLSHTDILWADSMFGCEFAYFELLEHGWKPQQARGVLPIDLKTEIAVTANLREWRHIFTLRTALPAHPQMRELMTPLLNECKELIPIIFDDIKGVV